MQTHSATQLFGPERRREPLTRVTDGASPCQTARPPRPAAHQQQRRPAAARTAVTGRSPAQTGTPLTPPTPPLGRQRRGGRAPPPGKAGMATGWAYPLHVPGACRPPAASSRGRSAPWGAGARHGLRRQSHPRRSGTPGRRHLGEAGTFRRKPASTGLPHGS